MIWKKNKVPSDRLAECFNVLMNDIKKGTSAIESMRCVYIQEDETFPHVLTPFDFMDLDPKPQIKAFYLYQAFKN